MHNKILLKLYIFSSYQLYLHHQICNNNYCWTRRINYRDNKSLKCKQNMNIMWEIYGGRKRRI